MLSFLSFCMVLHVWEGGVSGPSLLIESTDSMMEIMLYFDFHIWCYAMKQAIDTMNISFLKHIDQSSERDHTQL